MTAPRPRPKQLDAGILQAEISSFALRLAAEGKAAKTIRTYTEALQWFAAAHLPGRASWEQVSRQDIQQWLAWLLDRYSNPYASNQYRGLQQFFKWLAAEDELPDPMAGLQPPRVTDKLVPVFTGEELTRLDHARAGRSFAQRRDTAIIAVLKATGIRLAELAGLRYDPGDPRCSDIDLWRRAITVRGKGGKDRIGHQATRSLDRYLRARCRHAQAWRSQLWLGAGSREPLTAAGIYQMIARRGRQCGVGACPYRFRHQHWILPSPCSCGSIVLTPGALRRQPGRDRQPLQEHAQQSQNVVPGRLRKRRPQFRLRDLHQRRHLGRMPATPPLPPDRVPAAARPTRPAAAGPPCR